MLHLYQRPQVWLHQHQHLQRMLRPKHGGRGRCIHHEEEHVEAVIHRRRPGSFRKIELFGQSPQVCVRGLTSRERLAPTQHNIQRWLVEGDWGRDSERSGLNTRTILTVLPQANALIVHCEKHVTPSPAWPCSSPSYQCPFAAQLCGLRSGRK